MRTQDGARPAARVERLLAAARDKLALGELDEARRQIDAFIRLQPDRPVGFAQRAAIAHRGGDLQGAIGDMQRALDLTQGERVPYVLWLARMILADGRPDEAGKLLDAALARLGDRAPLLAQGMKHAATLGDLDMAEDYGARYLAVYQEDPDAAPQHLIALAYVRLDQLQADAAFDVLEQALQQWPGAVSLLLAKAHIHASVGRKGTARALIRNEVLAQPDLDPAVKARAQDVLDFLEGRAYVDDSGKTVLIEPPLVDDELATEMNSDATQGVFVRRSPGARKLVLVFSGLAREACGVPLSVLDAMLRDMPLHVAYLRDVQRLLYLKGIPEFGADFAETVEGLRSLQRDLGATSLFCIGASAGGYAAIAYGTALGADTVLGLAAATTTDFEVVRNFDARGAGLGRRLQAEVPDLLGNLRTQVENASHPPRLHLHYGADMLQDRVHAEGLAGLPDAHLFPAAGLDRHSIGGHLYAQGRLEQVLREALREELGG